MQILLVRVSVKDRAYGIIPGFSGVPEIAKYYNHAKIINLLKVLPDPVAP